MARRHRDQEALLAPLCDGLEGHTHGPDMPRVDERVVRVEGLEHLPGEEEEVLALEIADMACERIKAAITQTLAGDRPVKASFPDSANAGKAVVF
jgi:hypothetical protein